MLLADAGARVIKVEEPGRGDETRRWGPPFAGNESAYFLSINRGKESLTLNLKSVRGREIARKLVRRADVVLENFRADQRKEFGLTAAAVRRVNPRSVVCSIRGFESDSADADLPSYDLLAQGASGMLWVTGEPDRDPVKAGVAVADVLTAHYAFGAITSALYSRRKSRRGASLEISLFGSTVASLINLTQNYLLTGKEPGRHGSSHPSIVPYQAFHASDRLFVLAVATDRHFAALVNKVLDRSDLSNDQRYATNADRVRNRGDLVSELSALFRSRTAAQWVEACRNVGIPAAIVATVGEALYDTSLVGNIAHPGLGELPVVRNPVRFDSKHLPLGTAPPLLGQHTGRILAELGYSAAQIRDFKARGVA